MVKVNLKGRYGYGRPRTYYGPGETEVPEGLAAALGLKPLQEVAGTEEEGGAPLDLGEQIGGFQEVPDSQPLPEVDPLADFPELRAAGYTSVEQVRSASDDDLLNIKGIGPATLEKIRIATTEG